MPVPSPAAPPLAGVAAAPARAAGRRLLPSTRWWLAAAALLLLVTRVAPLWHIGLKAPQYPEGLGMYIWADRITGQKPNDLNSINGLNHYIGMKPIVPESIPELRLMPLVVAGLVAAGLLAALRGRRAPLYAWTAAFALGAVIGLADFWRWGYDYGHDLSPDAAIRIPGMSYQPPLVGTKQLLNFEATSLPAAGGWVALAALGIALALCAREWRRARREAP
jgi:copper chaperone NosL